MAAQRIHLARIKEHLEELKDALSQGIEQRAATIGFHTSACSIDFLECYLHKTGKIPLGKQVKHDWFKRPTLDQKIKPLAERQLPIDFLKKKDIFDAMYALEEKRNKLLYGNASLSEIQQMINAFDRLKKIFFELLEGDIEDPNH